MSWKRKYLKHKSCEDYPMRLSMRRSAKWKNCNWTPGIWGHSSKLHMMYVKIDKFLKASVGKNYDDVYSEFRRKFPAYYGGRDLVEFFKSSFIEHQNRNWNGKYDSFYVEDGIIKDGYVKPTKSKTVKINVRSKVINYSFTDYVFKDQRLLDIINTYLPGNYYKYLIPGITFSERVHDNIKYHLTKKPILEELVLLYNDQWFRNKGWYGCTESSYSWTGSHYVKTGKSVSYTGVEVLIFNKHVIEDCDIVELGSPEFNRYFENNRKKKASIERYNAKIKEAEREALLHDLLQARKKKEKEENELIRDRHGFDNHSFKNW